MKNAIMISAIAACVLAAPIASAQDKHAHGKPAASADKDQHMNQMQERMKAMQAQMETIRIATDPAVKQRLMQEHMLAMQEGMKGMRGMGGGQHGGMAMGGKKGAMKEGDMMKHHAMMEARVDMMQMMMEQMMQREQMMQPMPSR